MPKKSTWLFAALACAMSLALGAVPASAITGGTRDEVHTNVGLVRFTTDDGRFRCSGTLISPTVVLTAGHCTEGPATDVYVSFDTDLQPDPLAPGISPAERAAREAHYITGTAHPDPGWDGQLQFPKQHDQGVVVLDAAAATKWPGIMPAPLPPVGYLDRNQGRLKNSTFTLVGYGVDIGTRRSRSWSLSVADDRTAEERPDRGGRIPEQRQRRQRGRRVLLRRLGRGGVRRRLRARRRLLRQLAELQRHRDVPARRHPLLEGVPGHLAVSERARAPRRSAAPRGCRRATPGRRRR